MARRIALILLSTLLAHPVSIATADSPLPPPTETQFRSPNGQYLAVSDPNKFLTTVYELGPRPGARTVKWSMFGWMRQAALADDGVHLLVITESLIPLDFDKANPVLILVHKGEVIKTASVMDVVRNESNLKRTVSHYAWARDFLGPDREGRFRIQTEDDKIFFMNIFTGETGFLLKAPAPRK